MTFNVAICDDELSDASHIAECLIQNDKAVFKSTIFTDATKFKEAYAHPGAFDIVFLDVEMPGIDGLEIAKHIRSLPDYKVKIIFVSSYPAYMQNSFDVQAYHFLEKPASVDRICAILSKIITEKKTIAENRLVIRNNNGDYFINYEDLYYVNVDGTGYRNVCFHLKDNVITAHMALKTCEQLLLENNFIYIHRSTMVNLRHLHMIEKKSVTLDNKVQLKLSRRFEHEIRQKYIKYNVGTLYLD